MLPGTSPCSQLLNKDRYNHDFYVSRGARCNFSILVLNLTLLCSPVPWTLQEHARCLSGVIILRITLQTYDPDLTRGRVQNVPDFRLDRDVVRKYPAGCLPDFKKRRTK